MKERHTLLRHERLTIVAAAKPVTDAIRRSMGDLRRGRRTAETPLEHLATGLTCVLKKASFCPDSSELAALPDVARK